MKYPHEIQKKGRTSMVTAYDAFFSQLLEEAGVDAILVGDSLANMVQGHRTTLPVTMDQMLYHTEMVVRGAPHTLVVADMPFLSVEISIEEAVRHAGMLIKQGGAGAVKVETHPRVVPMINAMVASGIPVMAHIGLTPQWVHMLGGYKKQGTTPIGAEQLCALGLEASEAGAFAVVLEHMPDKVAHTITQTVPIPTIGIGAGPHCDGQIRVVHDILGLTKTPPAFVTSPPAGRQDALATIRRFCTDTKAP